VYAYTDKYVVVHDFGNLGPTHMLIIPTTVAVPDVMAMCVPPVAGSDLHGPTVLAEMKALALGIFRQMCGAGGADDGVVYAPNLRALGEIYGLTAADADPSGFWGDGLPKRLMAMFNMPVSQNQLHLHILVLPFFQSQMDKAFERNGFDNWCHWGWPRTVTLRTAERCVAGAAKENGGAGSMTEAQARVVCGEGDSVEGKDGSDWHEFCWKRLEVAKAEGHALQV
jgi:hypothetical protein